MAKTTIATTIPPSSTAENDPTPPTQSPPFTTSIAQLRNLSAAFISFIHHYDDLQNHLDLIQTSLDSKLPQTTLIQTPSSNTVVPTSPNSHPENDQDTLTLSELRNICRNMDFLGLRKHIGTHLQQPTTLRHELTQALKSAPDPSNIVIQTFGKACLQSEKAFLNDPFLVPKREGCVLLLESFLLLMGCQGVEIEIKPTVKLEAEAAAGVWRKRLITSGGLGKACDVDARGLLVLIVCFGVPAVFTNEDVGDLFWAGNLYRVKEIYASLLKHSVILARIKGIVEASAKHKMEIEALNLAYTIGISFSPQAILTSFLRESKATWVKSTKNAQGSTSSLKKANNKHLADLNSVKKLLKDHKIDPFPGWQIDEKILSLKKEMDDLDKKVELKVKPKRKVDEPKREENETKSLKRLKPQKAIPSRFAGHLERKSPYDGSIPLNLDRRLPVRTSTYSASPSALHRPSAISLHESIRGSTVDRGHLVYATGVGAGISTGISGVRHIDAYPGGGQTMNRDDQTYGWRGDTTLNERLVSRDFAGQISSAGLTSLYSSSSSLDSFAGLPHTSSIGVSSHSLASDLYQFADVVMESEMYHTSGSRASGTLPPVARPHRSSYLY